jgi:hypothetical protein
MVAGAVAVLRRRTIDSVRRTPVCVLLVLGLAGCGAGGKPSRPDAQANPHRAPLPAAPISGRTLTLSGRIVIVNGWQGVVTGQRLRVAAGRYAHSGEGVALVSDANDLEREVRAPRGEGALRFLRRHGPALELRSRRGHRFLLNLRTLRLSRPDAPPPCPKGALRGPLPRLKLRFTVRGLHPLPAPKSDAFAALLAIVSAPGGRVVEIDARPATHAPCGLASRSLAARVSVATPGPIVGVIRETRFVARFARGWRVWAVQR